VSVGRTTIPPARNARAAASSGEEATYRLPKRPGSFDEDEVLELHEREAVHEAAEVDEVMRRVAGAAGWQTSTGPEPSSA